MRRFAYKRRRYGVLERERIVERFEGARRDGLTVSKSVRFAADLDPHLAPSTIYRWAAERLRQMNAENEAFILTGPIGYTEDVRRLRRAAKGGTVPARLSEA